MKSLLVLSVMLAASQLAYAGDASGGGNGGGGVRRNGQLLTFREAELDLESDAILIRDVPGLNRLTDAIVALPIRAAYKSGLLSAIVPGDAPVRKYYKVGQDAISPQKRRALVKIYRELLGVQHAEKVALYAVTEGGSTYLFPEFFELGNDDSKAEILFHEALWAYRPSLTYRDVVAAEIAFGRWLKGQDNRAIFESLAQILEDPYVVLRAVAMMDRQNNAFGDDAKDGKLPLSILTGENWTPQSEITDPYRRSEEEWFFCSYRTFHSRPLHWLELKKRYPKSLLVSYLAENASRVSADQYQCFMETAPIYSRRSYPFDLGRSMTDAKVLIGVMDSAYRGCLSTVIDSGGSHLSQGYSEFLDTRFCLSNEIPPLRYRRGTPSAGTFQE